MNFRPSELHGESESDSPPSASFPGISGYSSDLHKHCIFPFLVPVLLESVVGITRYLALSKHRSILEISSYFPFLNMDVCVLKRNNHELPVPHR